MVTRLSALLCLVAVSAAAAHTTEPVSRNPPQLWTVTLSALVDGSGVFHFSDEALTYTHKHWDRPENVQLNGHPWQDLDKSPEDWDAHRGKLDLTHAWVTHRQGRDTVAVETTKTGFSVYLSDSPNGAANYSITIAIPLVQAL